METFHSVTNIFKCSINKKMIHLPKEYYSDIKNIDFVKFAGMDGTRKGYSECGTQTQKDKHDIYSFISGY